MLCSPSTKMLRKSMLCSPSTKMPGQYVFVTAGPIIKLTLCVCVYYCSTYYKAVRVGEGDSGGHVLRKTTSRGLSGLVCPSCTSERGGEGDCVKEGGGEGQREKERALGRSLVSFHWNCHIKTYSEISISVSSISMTHDFGLCNVYSHGKRYHPQGPETHTWE